VLQFGIIGVVAGSAVASVLSAAAGLAVLARARLLRLRVDTALWRPMLAFSLPLVPAALAGWTLNLSDRYILQAMTGEATVGVYALGYTAGLAVNALAVQPFAIAWGATYWELSKRDDARQLFALVLTAYLGLACFAALLLSTLGTDVIRALLRPEFEPSRFVVPFSAFAYVLYGVFTVVTTGINLESQTRRLPLTMGLAAVVGVVANLVLIPLFSYLGAALATLLAYGVLVVASGHVSQRYYPVAWRTAHALVILGVAGALSAAALLGPDHIAWRLACVAAYPPLLLATRVLTIRQLGAVRRALTRRPR
jgi:O-antigen/teichoic acid export membrane protein